MLMDEEAVEASVRRLVEVVGHAFYTQEQAVLLDYALRSDEYGEYPVTEEAAVRDLIISNKVVREGLNVLSTDRLLKKETRTQAVLWYLDPAMFVDAVRFKVLSIQRAIADEIRKRETDVKCYVCRNCGRAYNNMEVMEFAPTDTAEWACQDCGQRLEYDADAQQTSKAFGERLDRQLAPFREILRTLHDAKIPTRAPPAAGDSGQGGGADGDAGADGSGSNPLRARFGGGRRGVGAGGSADREVAISFEATDSKAAAARLPAAPRAPLPWMQAAGSAASAAAAESAQPVDDASFPEDQPRSESEDVFQAADDEEFVDATSMFAGAGGAAAAGNAELAEAWIEVGSEQVLLADVTDDHIAQMTPEQYEHYAAVLRALELA